MSALDSQISSLGTLNSRGKRELAAELRRMQSQIVTGSPVTGAPAREPVYVPPPPRAPPTTTQVFDQHGNAYTQPPGSAFVTDNKAGKTCFKNGSFLHCK